MDFIDLFKAMGVVVIGLIAFFSLATDLNLQYGSDIGSNLSSTRDRVQGLIVTDLNTTANSAGASILPQSGADEGDEDQNLLRRARNTLSQFNNLLGLPASVIRDAGDVLSVPELMTDIAVWTFYFTFALTMAYLLLLGIRRITG